MYSLNDRIQLNSCNSSPLGFQEFFNNNNNNNNNDNNNNIIIIIIIIIFIYLFNVENIQQRNEPKKNANKIGRRRILV